MMRIISNIRTFFVAAAFLGAAFFVSPIGMAYADEPGGYKIVDGTEIYFAVIPAQILRGHKAGHTEATMHGGVPSAKHTYHVMVALFDAGSFERITDAKVKANVAEVGLAGKKKPLEPFTVNDSLTYGNYFQMPSHAVYRIKVTVQRPGSEKTIETTFEYRHR